MLRNEFTKQIEITLRTAAERKEKNVIIMIIIIKVHRERQGKNNEVYPPRRRLTSGKKQPPAYVVFTTHRTRPHRFEWRLKIRFYVPTLRRYVFFFFLLDRRILFIRVSCIICVLRSEKTPSERAYYFSRTTDIAQKITTPIRNHFETEQR